MFWGMVELQLVEDTPCFSRFKSGIERSRRMDVEIVENHPDDIGLREMNIHQITHQESKILVFSVSGDGGITPARERLKNHKQVAHALTHILIIVAGRLSRLHWEGGSAVRE